MHSRSLVAKSNDLILLVLRQPVEPLYERLAKRLLDILGALALIVLFAPVMLVVALVVRLDGGPAVFSHRRIGAKGRPFHCLKFRSMRVNAQEMLQRHLAENAQARAEWAESFKLRQDPRITPIGRFLRRSSLDELPQLFNVLAGDMSLVGPRPIIRPEIERYAEHFDLYVRCRPGLTGLWQISGRSDVSYDRRVALDAEYVRNWSLLLDIKIILLTPIRLLFGAGAY